MVVSQGLTVLALEWFIAVEWWKSATKKIVKRHLVFEYVHHCPRSDPTNLQKAHKFLHFIGPAHVDIRSSRLSCKTGCTFIGLVDQWCEYDQLPPTLLLFHVYLWIVTMNLVY